MLILIKYFFKANIENGDYHPNDLERVKKDSNWLRAFYKHSIANNEKTVAMAHDVLSWRKEFEANGNATCLKFSRWRLFILNFPSRFYLKICSLQRNCRLRKRFSRKVPFSTETKTSTVSPYFTFNSSITGKIFSLKKKSSSASPTIWSDTIDSISMTQS